MQLITDTRLVTARIFMKTTGKYADIQTECLRDTSLLRYRYTKILDL